MAENIDVNVNVNTTQANRNLDNLNNRIGLLNRSFSAFKNVLGGLALGGIITNTLRFADSIQDVSDATGIATANILGFSQAVSQNGGNFENAQTAIQKFVQTIGEAASGSAKTQQAFAEVGVTLEDLRTLSEQEILEKTIKGLADIDDYSKRAVLQTELLGKSLRGVNIQGVAAGLGAATRESQQYAIAIKSAADTQQALDTSLNNLRIALLDVLKPLADVLKEFTASIETIKNVIKVLLVLGAAVASMTLLGRVAALLAGSFRVLAGAAEAIQAGALNLSIRLGNLGKVGQFLSDKIAALGIWFSSLISKSPKLAAAIEYIGAAFTSIAGVIGGAAAAFALFDSEAEKSQKIVEAMNAESARLHSESNRRAEENQKNIRDVTDALTKQAQEIRNVTQAYKDSNDELVRNLQLEASYLQMSSDVAEIAKAQEEIFKRATDTIAELQAKKASLTKEEAGLIPVIDQQIKIIEQSIIKDQLRAEQAIKNIQAIRNAQEDLNKSIEQQKIDIDIAESLGDLQEQLALIGQYGEQLEYNQMILSVTNELQKKLTDYQKDLLDLQKQKGQLTEEQYAKELAHINVMIQKAYDYAGARLEAEQKILDAQKAVQENATAGAKQAMDSIAEQFKPYNMAQEAILSTWGNISSAIDKFVETGKFKFSDFARSVIQDLAKMIAKAMIFKAISTALGAFGIKIPGLAEGGPVKGGQPYIVGEKGPELFVPQGNGKIVPNNQLQGSSQGGMTASAGPITNNYNTYNIQALDAKSVAQLFAENRKAIFGANKMAEREMSYVGVR